MKSKRLFLGFPVNKILTMEMLRFKNNFVHQFSQFPSFKWVPEQNYHLTLLFIGSVPADEIAGIFRKSEKLFAGAEKFLLTPRRFVLFPPRRPRMVWLEFESSDAYRKLAASTRQKILGTPADNAFIPHVTLARFKRAAKPNVQWPADPLLKLKCEKIHLYESDLRPGGTVYRILKTYETGK